MMMRHEGTDDGALPPPDDGRFVATINPTAFCGGYAQNSMQPLYRNGTMVMVSHDDATVHETEYSSRLRSSIGIKNGVFHYDDDAVTSPPPTSTSSAFGSPAGLRRWGDDGGAGGSTSMGDGGSGLRLWQRVMTPNSNRSNHNRFNSRALQLSPPPVLAMSPVVVGECATPGEGASQHDASLAEATPGGFNCMSGMSPRCVTPLGQRMRRGGGNDDGGSSASPQWNTPGSIASAVSPLPPRSQHQADRNGQHGYSYQQPQHISPLSSPDPRSTPRSTQGTLMFGTPSRQLGRRDTSPLSRHPSPYTAPPPALLQHTPSKTLRTPVRGLQNSLSPSTGGDGYSQPASLNLTPSRLQCALPGAGGNALGGGINTCALFRRQESMTATRVLDGTGLLRDPISKPVAYGAVSQLIAALHCTVFQWSPTSLTTLIEAPCAVTAVAASGLGYCVHHYAAVGLENGIVHIFEFNPDSTVRASVMENQLQSRVTCLCLFEEILYCGSDDGVFLAIDLGRLFQLKQQRSAANDASSRTSTPSTTAAGGRTPPPPPPLCPPTSSSSESASDVLDSPPYTAVVAVLPAYMQHRLDIGAPILCMEVSDDGNHLAIGCGKGLVILHRSQMTHPVHLDDEGPVRTLSWAPSSLGLSIVVYASGDRHHSKLVVRSLSGGVKQQKETFAELISVRCCRHTPECVVAHGQSIYPSTTATAGGGGDDTGVSHLSMYDLQGFRVRKSTRLSGHREDVHFLTLDPQGDMLISASMDASIRFWDVSDPSTTTSSGGCANSLRDLLAGSTAVPSSGGGGSGSAGPLRYLLERHHHLSQYDGGGSEFGGAMLR